MYGSINAAKFVLLFPFNINNNESKTGAAIKNRTTIIAETKP